MGNTAPPAKWASAWVKAHPILFALASMLTVLSALTAPDIELNFSPDRLFASDEPDYLYYKEHVAPVFGADDKVCIIAVEGSLAHPKAKEMLRQLVAELDNLSFVEEILSPLDMLIPSKGVLDFISFANATTFHDANLKQAAQHPLYRSFLLSPDASTFALYARLQSFWEKMNDQDDAVREIRSILKRQARAFPEFRFSLAGVPASQERIVTTLLQEQGFFIPLVFLLLSFFLYLIFRDLRGVFIPFMVTATAALWCIGWMTALGHDINIVNNSIIVLLVVIGVADSMHIFSRYLEECQRREPAGPLEQQEAVAACISAMAIPCFLTTTTTAIGFFAAMSAKMEVIQTFGIEAAFGVLGAYVATMCMTPTLLILFPKPILAASWSFPLWMRAPALLSRILHFALHWRKGVLLLAGLSLGVGAWGIRNLQADQYLVGELPSDDPTVESTRLVEERFSGVLPFAVLFEGSPQRLKEPDVLRMLSRLSEVIEQDSIGPQVISYADLYQSLWVALNPDKKAEVHTWTDAQVEQIGLLLDTFPEDHKKAFDNYFLSSDHSMMRLVGFAPDVGSASFLIFQKALEAFLASNTLPHVKMTLTGGQVYASSVFAHLFTDLLWSMVTAFFLIFLFIAMVFRSLSISVLAVLPNALPILLTLAMMAFTGMDLRISTIVVFPMALGIAVDACIHLIARWREENQACILQNENGLENLPRLALEKTFLTSGQPVLFSILVFLFGLSVLAFSKFGALQEFGFLASITLGVALVVDLVVLPAAIFFIPPKKTS